MSVGWNLTDLKTPPSGAPVVASTFSCGGGSSMGYKLAGCDVALANDIDPEMAWHYKTNLHPKNYILGPVKSLASIELPITNVDILDGSPPCSTFSTAGLREKAWGKKKHFREGQAEQVLDDLFFDFLDVAERIRPRAIIAENVKGMLAGNARGYLKMISERLKSLGYTSQVYLLTATMFGVAQRRERVFVCARRDDVKPRKATLTFAPTVTKALTFDDVTKDLKLTKEERAEVAFKPGGIDEKWWPLTKQGEGYNKVTQRTIGVDKLWNHLRLSSDKPAPTLPSVWGTMKHPTEPRVLTFREWKRLGSFPDDYVAKKNSIGRYMIGMSVPPLMMKAVAKAVVEQWL